MYGGLLKTASAAAILAAAGLFGASSAKAADLGGDCCADLEERVAELEATTVRKGNRKMSVTLSGFVGHNVMWWDDGTRSDVYIGDGGNYGSRFRFVGTAKISPTLSAGFLYEFGIANNQIGSMNQFNGGDDLPGNSTSSSAQAQQLRDSTVWLRHSQLGMIKVGHGSTATDNLILIDLGGMAGAGTADIGLYAGGFVQAGGTFPVAETWGAAANGGLSFDTTRRNHILYETPAIAGFTVQAALAEDNFWDVALRYAGEFSGFRLAFGVGYMQDTEFNGPAAAFCATDCNRKETELKGSASLLHVGTGLFVTAAAGKREIEDSSTLPDHDASFWYVATGVRKNFFGFGDTVLFGEYGEANDMMIRVDPTITASDFSHWGIGVNQYIDAAAMEVFLVYKTMESSHCHGAACFSGDDIQTVIGGARVNF